MKMTEKKKSVDTIPKGVWESSRPEKEKEEKVTVTQTTDLQGNGYPYKNNHSNKQSK